MATPLLPGALLLVLLAAREAWWGQRPWPGMPELERMVAHPAAAVADAMTVAAAKARLRADRA